MITLPTSSFWNALLETRFSMFLGRIAARLRDAFNAHVPFGYEDETGFHFGTEAVQEPKSPLHFSI